MKKIIGILGGMGPEAGVKLQEYIIRATPATKDQDHCEVVCYTASHVRDRSASLAADGGKAYLADVIEAAQMLVKTGVDVIAIPCNTAHSRLAEIQAEVAVPIVNMVDLTVKQIRKEFEQVPVGLLATNGTLQTNLYQRTAANLGLTLVLPTPDEQKTVMGIIYDVIKAGKTAEKGVRPLVEVAAQLTKRGAQVLIAGCTELSLVTSELGKAGMVADPMWILAEELVRIGK